VRENIFGKSSQTACINKKVTYICSVRLARCPPTFSTLTSVSNMATLLFPPVHECKVARFILDSTEDKDTSRMFASTYTFITSNEDKEKPLLPKTDHTVQTFKGADDMTIHVLQAVQTSKDIYDYTTALEEGRKHYVHTVTAVYKA
jgi:hypothetical protein